MEDTTTEVMLLGGSPFAYNCTNTLQAQFIEALRNRLKLGSDSNGNGGADLLGVINLLNTGVHYVGSEEFKAKLYPYQKKALEVARSLSGLVDLPLMAAIEKSAADRLDDIFKDTGVKVTKHMHDEYIVEGSEDQVQSLLSQIRVLESISTVRETNAKPVAPKLKVAKHKWKSDRRHFYDPDSVLEPCVCEVCGLRRYKVVAKQSKSGAKVLYDTKYVMDQHVFHKAPACTAHV